MSGVTILGLTGSVLILLALFEMMRRHRLREKYAALWIRVAVVVLLGAFFPQIPAWFADLVGVTTPVNLVFFLGLLVLLVVCVQLSGEVSGLEHENQTLAEESALLRNRIETLERHAGLGATEPPVADPGPGGGAAG